MQWKKNWFVAPAATLASVFMVTVVYAQSMSNMSQMHEPLVGAVLVDKFEYRAQDGQDVIAWEADAWYGGDYHKVWLKTKGEYSLSDAIESAEVQLLYSRLIDYYWDLQVGVRHDFEPDPSRSYGVIGLQGLAPGYFELDLQGFVSEQGDFTARFEAEYDLLITQRLILQPNAEITLAAQDVPELGLGSGINDVELGLRLRYEFSRKFAPYVGLAWERKLGETAILARSEGEDVDSLSLVAGVRFWF